MNKMVAALVVLAAVAVLAACTMATSGKRQAGHPALSAQAMLIACDQCHMEKTPTVYQQWYDSTHGLDNVKCYQCHGTFENLKRTPELASCNACHADKMGDHRAGQLCWECHTAHTFDLK